MGRYPSGQRGQTVNLLPSASKVRTLACPPCSAGENSKKRRINFVKKFFIAKNLLNNISRESCGRSSVVEFQPSKLAVVGSNPIARSIFDFLSND